MGRLSGLLAYYVGLPIASVQTFFFSVVTSILRRDRELSTLLEVKAMLRRSGSKRSMVQAGKTSPTP